MSINNREDANNYYKLINGLVDDYIDNHKIRPSKLSSYLKPGGQRFNKFLERNKLKDVKGAEIILKDDIFFWKTRANYLNNASGRRRGKAGLIISSSEPIKAEELLELYILQNKSCSYCKITLDKKDIVFDHKIPLSREGKHDINNLVVSCKDCNNLKSTRNSEEFANFLKLYISRF
jgi:5-methylcytosine-specific restriction endonuclease McrA